ncbi:hypothetical protein OHA_1_01254 [Pleomorphomonas sp. SM30]|uniref:Parallel beta helix pectate lyase-like protein n=2 Tax=Oharaeibacter diazotrophicus TaxID=1920512 RepID=A0A4R6RJV4_9HYPH|nr:hypothetical protein EDD54_0256 [Oharaeibacter diazotrophicus]BBE71672.1 hypothetical protein OHA_1_01254 [Pleomorphomonas sp. SM30]GLS78437.1 hypothetical protein GCM10007904_37740 [Oharaeibacter diazotrophicus]
MRNFVALSVLGAALAASAVPAAAAGFARVVVAVTGTDTADCGLPTTPCRTFQTALGRAIPGGIVVTAGPGNYGPMKITKSVAVLNDGAGIATVERGDGPPIVVQLSGTGGSVVLRGLTVDGRSTANAGIAFVGTGKLLVSKSLVQGTQTGISIVPTSGGDITIEDSVVTDNLNGVVSSGVSSGSLTVTLSHVTISGNGLNPEGVGLKASGGAAAYQFVAMTDTTIADNGTGVSVQGSDSNAIVVTATDSAIVNNGTSAVIGSGGTLTLDRTMVRSNFFGTIVNAGSIVSYGNNAIVDNVTGNPISPAALK